MQMFISRNFNLALLGLFGISWNFDESLVIRSTFVMRIYPYSVRTTYGRSILLGVLGRLSLL